VALYWLAYEITGSAWALGILGFCAAAPRLLLGAIGGVIVDRYDRLRLLTAIQILCCVPFFGLVALYFLGVLQFWHMALLETNPTSTLRGVELWKIRRLGFKVGTTFCPTWVGGAARGE
jgi:hypothetical protein